MTELGTDQFNSKAGFFFLFYYTAFAKCHVEFNASAGNVTNPLGVF